MSINKLYQVHRSKQINSIDSLPIYIELDVCIDDCFLADIGVSFLIPGNKPVYIHVTYNGADENQMISTFSKKMERILKSIDELLKLIDDNEFKSDLHLLSTDDDSSFSSVYYTRMRPSGIGDVDTARRCVFRINSCTNVFTIEGYDFTPLLLSLRSVMCEIIKEIKGIPRLLKCTA